MWIHEQDKLRFASNLSIGDSNQCWMWQGHKTRKGYGVFNINLRQKRAHVVSFIIFYKKNVPKHLQVLHKCDNPLCVNPYHLFLGTQKDNMVDKVNKGRAANGERNGSCKLTDVQVESIKKEYTPGIITLKDLGTKYGVNLTTIWEIVRGTSRKTPTNPEFN